MGDRIDEVLDALPGWKPAPEDVARIWRKNDGKMSPLELIGAAVALVRSGRATDDYYGPFLTKTRDALLRMEGGADRWTEFEDAACLLFPKMILGGNRGAADLSELTKLFGDLSGYYPLEAGAEKLSRLLPQYNFHVLLRAVAQSCDLLKWDETGKYVTRESANEAFDAIPSRAFTIEASKNDPEAPRLYYIRGILRNRFPDQIVANTASDREAIAAIRSARSLGWSVDEMEEKAKVALNLADFFGRIRGAR